MKCALLLVLATTATAAVHVGTDDVSYMGNAGPYPVRVTIRQPGVVPGLADITIRTPANGIDRVLVTALRRVGNTGEAPPPDEAVPVPGETGLYSAQLWLMVRGPHSVIVTLRGASGEGRVTVPIVARATARLEMPRSLGFVLAAGGLFLIVGLLSIVAAASRESGLPIGAAPSRRDFRRARIATIAAGLGLAVLLFGGWNWIRAEADAHRASLDRPWLADAKMDVSAMQPILRFTMTDPRWINRPRNQRVDLVPDHGKMMHLFVVDADDANAFAHVHPIRLTNDSFAVPFPPLPAGSYRLFGDVVLDNGVALTLVSDVEARTARNSPGGAIPRTAERVESLDAAVQSSNVDPDDAWWIGEASAGNAAMLDDGLTMRWQNHDAPLIAGSEHELVFAIDATAGRTPQIEPYMGMAGHAMLAKRDGSVFVHLHPSGMISVAAQAALEADASAALDAVPHATHQAGATASTRNELRFPLVVPSSGIYRVWVQVKEQGRIRTVAFDTEITQAR